MPGGPDETHQHEPTSMTEQVASNPSSKTGTTASDHPAYNGGEAKGDKVQFLYHKANPGPVMPKEINVQQEGTRKERQKRMEEMNNGVGVDMLQV